ncbi:hypothetical protein PHMEG_00027436 [Phytophthora megakarya]|uniref:Uncharacterized protein n=1 Tax=Phytophthora megakarya TaxID=4795 RepID=A0A225V791_9STRA|nr:hypothetical protein PHMEG_00027436 [Phytophthora megakarya]
MEQRGVTGKSAFGNVRSATVYLFTQTEALRTHDFDSLMGCIIPWHELPRTATSDLQKGRRLSLFSMFKSVAQPMLKSTKKGIYSDTSFFSCVGISCAVPKVLKPYDTPILFGERIRLQSILPTVALPLLTLDCCSNKLKTGFRSKQIPTREEHVD